MSLGQRVKRLGDGGGADFHGVLPARKSPQRCGDKNRHVKKFLACNILDGADTRLDDVNAIQSAGFPNPWFHIRILSEAMKRLRQTPKPLQMMSPAMMVIPGCGNRFLPFAYCVEATLSDEGFGFQKSGSALIHSSDT